MTMLNPLPVPRFPLSAVTPFTYRDGTTYLEILESFRVWIDKELTPRVNENVLTMDQALKAAQDAFSQTQEDFLAHRASVSETLENSRADMESAFATFTDEMRADPLSVSDTLLNNALVKSQLDSTYIAHTDKRVSALDRGDAQSFRVRDGAGEVALKVDAVGDTHIGSTRHREGSAGFRVADSAGQIALEVSSRGHTRVGRTVHDDSHPNAYRIRDSEGRIAFEIDSRGRTHIYDLVEDDESNTRTVDTLHIFIAAGQSNMSGRGQPVDIPRVNRIMQFGVNRRTIEVATPILDMVDNPTGTSPAFFFARNYLASQPSNVAVLLIPAARGGTAFRGTPESPSDSWTWTKGAAPSPEFDLYERSVIQTADAIEAAKQAGYLPVLKGVLWHQGEGNGGMATEAYATLLDALIRDYRADLGHPTLPFIVGQMCPEGMEVTPSKYTVDAAHQDTPYRIPFTGFAPATWEGHNEGDTTHFSTRGTRYLGDTYLTGYIQALGNTNL